MKKSLAHLPQAKADEVKLIADKIRSLARDVQMVILFGSYARGDFKDGPHSQGRGRLLIHKTSDYDILVLTEYEHTARSLCAERKHNQKYLPVNSSPVRATNRVSRFTSGRPRTCVFELTPGCLSQAEKPSQAQVQQKLHALLSSKNP